MRRYLHALLLLLLPLSAQAIMVPIQIELIQGKGPQNVLVSNNDKTSHRYRLSLREVSFPDKDMKVLHDTGKDIWLNELAFSLRAHESRTIQIAYRGEPSEVERYYQLEVAELVDKRGVNQVGRAVNSIVVVSPLNLTLNVAVNDGILINHGKGSVLFMEDFDCGKRQGMSKLIAPGQYFTLPPLQQGSVHSVGADGQIKILTNRCLP